MDKVKTIMPVHKFCLDLDSGGWWDSGSGSDSGHSGSTDPSGSGNTV
jgi:hypothetical protein